MVPLAQVTGQWLAKLAKVTLKFNGSLDNISQHWLGDGLMQNWEQAIISPTDESVLVTSIQWVTLQWRHNGHDSVSNHQPHDCLLNRLFRRRSKKTSKLRVTALCAGNSPGTGEFPSLMASYAENVSIWWRHHDWTWTGSMSAKGHLIESSKCELSSALVMAVTCVVHNIMLCWTMAWRQLETPLYVLYQWLVKDTPHIKHLWLGFNPLFHVQISLLLNFWEQNYA